MTRPLGIAAAILLVALSVPRGDARASTPVRRPNLLFVLTDDQRFDALGAAGHPILHTPNLDRLAAEGVRFENAFVTSPICWVSRASILTGQWARAHAQPGHTDAVRPESLRTALPLELRAAGYRTGFFGKWDVRLPDGEDRTRLFDVYQDVGRSPYVKSQPDGTRRHETELVADRALAFLASQPQGQPFFLALWFNAPHAADEDLRPGAGLYPWPATMDGLYAEATIPPPRLGDPAIYEAQPPFLQRSLNRERFFWGYDTPEKYAANVRGYLRMVSGIDHELGRILQALGERGFADDTVVVYSSDNGYYLGDRGFQGKWSHYEESIRVPLIVFDPRLPKPQRGRVAPQLVLNVDLAPTFLDLAGSAIPAAYQGRSLLPLLRGAAPADWRSDFFAEMRAGKDPGIPRWEGVRGRGVVYARYYEHDFEFLHDLQADPDELRNLAGDPAQAELLAALRARTAELRARYGRSLDPIATPADEPRAGSSGASEIHDVAPRR